MLWRDMDPDTRRRHELLVMAGDDNPFKSVIRRFYAEHMIPEKLDEVNLALDELPELVQLKEQLDAEQPAFTTIFRYDPLSIRFAGFDGCFSSRQSMGASLGYGRIFEGLTSDKIHTLRTPEEVMVVIQHPSFYLDGRDTSYITEEPTVLFTSRMFEYDAWTGKSSEEEHQTGLIIKHAEQPIDVRPIPNILTSEAALQYTRFAIEHHKRTQPQAVEAEV